MIKAVIVEDEGVAARKLSKLLIAQDVEILEICQSNKELHAYLMKDERPDVFFMDIHLNDGVVFDTLSEVEVTTPIIFTTAYDQYAIKAFKQKSIDYLLKPIDEEELQVSLSKYQSIYKTNDVLDISSLSELIQSSKSSYRNRIKVKIGDRYKSFKTSDISMIYSASKITFIRTDEGRSYPIDQSVESIASELNPNLFFRVNRSQLVNIDFISEVVAFSNSRLKVTIIESENTEVVIARERVKLFKEWFG